MFSEIKWLSTLKIFGPDYVQKEVTIKVSKNSLNCATRTIRAKCLHFVYYYVFDDYMCIHNITALRMER